MLNLYSRHERAPTVYTRLHFLADSPVELSLPELLIVLALKLLTSNQLSCSVVSFMMQYLATTYFTCSDGECVCRISAAPGVGGVAASCNQRLRHTRQACALRFYQRCLSLLVW